MTNFFNQCKTCDFQFDRRIFEHKLNFIKTILKKKTILSNKICIIGI